MIQTLIVAALEAEAAPLARKLKLQPERSAAFYLTWTGSVAGQETAIIATGMGRDRATEVVRHALGRWPITRLFIFGLAGAVNPDLAVGDVIVPSLVVDAVSGARFERPLPEGNTGHVLRTGDEVVGDLASKARFFDIEFDAVDMETSAITRLAEQRSIPWACVRGISDAAGDPLPDYLAGFTDELGRARPLAVLLHLLRHPGHLPALMRVGRHAGLAVRQAGEILISLL